MQFDDLGQMTSDIVERIVRSAGDRDDNSAFFNCGTLEIVNKGQPNLTLPGVPEPEGFRHAILNACLAWVPGRAAEWMTFAPGKDAKK